jgi:hypothetical protein
MCVHESSAASSHLNRRSGIRRRAIRDSVIRFASPEQLTRSRSSSSVMNHHSGAEPRHARRVTLACPLKFLDEIADVSLDLHR